MPPNKTILHPTDFSERSGQAFQLACSLARDFGARLILAHVVEPVVPIYDDGLVLPPPVVSREELRTRLERLVPPGPGIAVEHRLLEGGAAPEIVRLAEETPADMIVMGTHGRRGLARLLMGSVAEQVVRKAPCPVVTVKVPFLTEEVAPENGTSSASGVPNSAVREEPAACKL